MINRKLNVDKLPRAVTVPVAARRLGVTSPTIRDACRRWSLGTLVKTSGNREQFFLSREDVKYLRDNLQDGPGRPPEVTE